MAAVTSCENTLYGLLLLRLSRFGVGGGEGSQLTDNSRTLSLSNSFLRACRTAKSVAGSRLLVPE